MARAQIQTFHSLAKSALRTGDLVFIQISAKPFKEVAIATGSWTNHVGIVLDASCIDPVIGESTFPLSRFTTLSRFVERSQAGRVAVARLRAPLSADQMRGLLEAAARRTGILYDTGFDIRSRRQFCSRYVREVLEEGAGVRIGDVETFETLLTRRPETRLGFWKLWYFGRIPWKRETVTPASLLTSEHVSLVFDSAETWASGAVEAI